MNICISLNSYCYTRTIVLFSLDAMYLWYARRIFVGYGRWQLQKGDLELLVTDHRDRSQSPIRDGRRRRAKAARRAGGPADPVKVDSVAGHPPAG